MKAALLLVVIYVGLSLAQPCNMDPDFIPVCTNGETPTTVNGCPSCWNANVIAPGCTVAQLQTCWQNQGNLPPCTSGVQPTRNPNTCCLSCKYTTPPCTRQQLETGVAAYGTLSTCGNTAPSFSTSTCKITCRRTPTAAETPSNGTCYSPGYYTCFGNTDTCRFGEIPKRNDANLCCADCIRPETSCQRADIVYCFRNIPTCSAGELPTYVQGECCPTCKRAAPVCSPACPTGQVCYPNHKDDTDNIVAACVATKTVYVKAATNYGNFNSSVTNGDILIFLREFMMRLCERIPNADICNQYAESNDDLDAKVQTWAVNRIQPDQITITMAVDTGIGLNKRQTSFGDIEDMLVTACNDDYAGVGYTFVVEPDGLPSSGDTSDQVIYPTKNDANGIVLSTFVLIALTLLV